MVVGFAYSLFVNLLGVVVLFSVLPVLVCRCACCVFCVVAFGCLLSVRLFCVVVLFCMLALLVCLYVFGVLLYCSVCLCAGCCFRVLASGAVVLCFCVL